MRKAMELLPLGPVVMIDTPGLDDKGELGELRVKKTEAILKEINIAVVVADVGVGLQVEDEELIALLEKQKVPYIIAVNKVDLEEGNENEELTGGKEEEVLSQEGIVRPENVSEEKILYVSALTGYHINLLKEKIAAIGKMQVTERKLVRDLIAPGDVVVLVVPIDEAAPKGRLILPQQQTIRDILDAGAISVVCKDTELEDTLKKLGVKPRLVITDSQAFGKVSKIVPRDIRLTSFSILFARYKGNLELLVNGAEALEHMRDGDKILMAEGCTHHRQCGDIGSVKIPELIRKHTGKNVEFEVCSGNDFPECLDGYALVVHCGGCTLTEQVMQRRLLECKEKQVPITNYGMAIAYMNGILSRSMEIFIESKRDLKQ